jgi:hypothetical protein
VMIGREDEVVLLNPFALIPCAQCGNACLRVQSTSEGRMCVCVACGFTSLIASRGTQ